MDVAGYRIYRQGNLAVDLKAPSATGADFPGLTSGLSQQFRITAYDTFNNESVGVYASATPLDADVTPPTGSITINGGALYTTTQSVTLTLTAIDPNGIDGMCLSSGATCGSWETFAATRIWDVGTGDGLKSVNIWYKDSQGNVTAQPYSASITLDITPPVVTALALPKGDYPANVSRAVSVPVVFTATDNLHVADYCLTETNNPGVCVWSQGSPGRYAFNDFGPHTLYAFVRDAAGNVSAPATSTVTTVATATLTVSIAGTSGGSVNGSGIACSSPPLSGICAVDYPLNTMVSLAQSTAGLFTGWSGACAGTGGCTVKLTGNQIVNATFASSKTARLACVTPPREYATLQQAYADAPNGCAIQTQAGTLLENLNLDVDKRVTIKGGYNSDFTDVTGASSLDGVLTIGKGTAIFDNLTITGTTTPLAKDTVAPTGSIAINQGAPYTATPLVTLDLTAADPSGVSDVCLGMTADCASWEPYAPAGRPWLLPEGEGLQTVNVWFRDTAGNRTVQPSSARITLDTTSPTVTSFNAPGDYPLNISQPLEAPVTLAAEDNYQLADYCLTEQSNPTNCSWQTNVPDKLTFAAFGPHTISAFVRDTAGNVSQPATASINLLPTASLAVELSGTGGGYVKSDPGGIMCNYAPLSGECAGEFPFNSSVLLQATPDSNSVLSRWSLPCSGTGDCLLKLTGNLKITGVMDHVDPILLTCVTPPKGYTLLQQAYDEAPDGCVLKIRAVSLQEALSLGQAKMVKIRGGYDTKYESVIGVTGLRGLSISKGVGLVENIEIK